MDTETKKNPLMGMMSAMKDGGDKSNDAEKGQDDSNPDLMDCAQDVMDAFHSGDAQHFADAMGDFVSLAGNSHAKPLPADGSEDYKEDIEPDEDN
jgi:hypothetical protein